MWKNMYSLWGHRWQYGARASQVGQLRLQVCAHKHTHTQTHTNTHTHKHTHTNTHTHKHTHAHTHTQTHTNTHTNTHTHTNTRTHTHTHTYTHVAYVILIELLQLKCKINNTEFLCITRTVKHNYILPISTVIIQLHVSVLYVIFRLRF